MLPYLDKYDTATDQIWYLGLASPFFLSLDNNVAEIWHLATLQVQRLTHLNLRVSGSRVETILVSRLKNYNYEMLFYELLS
jgi:hypothetical protein